MNLQQIGWEQRLLSKAAKAAFGFQMSESGLGGAVMKIAKLLLIMIVVLFGYAGTQVFAQKEGEQTERGKRLFMNYCASCHGVDAKGRGPVASSLKKQPTDLTKLQKGPKFPTSEVTKKISGNSLSPIHGKKDMPVWGLIFGQEDITNLVKYLESIQRLYEPQPAG